MSAPRPAPVFLFGFERSGTTLLSMMIGAHPKISCPLSATGTWWRLAARLAEFGDLATPQDALRMAQAAAQEERLRLWGVRFDPESLAARVRPGRFDDLVCAFHLTAAEAEGKARWANMDIATLFAFERAARLFPDARFVQILRDGRDVALSFKTYRYGGLNVFEVAEQWARATVAADRIGDALGPERYLRMRYEDLIADPAAALTRLCGFIGEDYAPAMLDYAEDVRRKVPEDKRDLWPALDRPPQQDRVARWRREMPASERYVFEEQAGEALARFGYERGAPGFSARGELRGAWQYLTRGARLSRLGFGGKRA